MWINDIWRDDDTIVLPKDLKNRARIKLRQAVQKGKLEKLPCEVCDDTNGIIDAHHVDYRLPLDVIWLCRKHHQELHKYVGFFEVYQN